VHPTLGILARFQAFFYASAFSQSDGVPPPAPARVTLTVGQLVYEDVNINLWFYTLDMKLEIMKGDCH
jgi:hypothetical protein